MPDWPNVKVALPFAVPVTLEPATAVTWLALSIVTAEPTAMDVGLIEAPLFAVPMI